MKFCYKKSNYLNFANSDFEGPPQSENVFYLIFDSRFLLISTALKMLEKSFFFFCNYSNQEGSNELKLATNFLQLVFFCEDDTLVHLWPFFWLDINSTVKIITWPTFFWLWQIFFQQVFQAIEIIYKFTYLIVPYKTSIVGFDLLTCDSYFTILVEVFEFFWSSWII